MQHKGLQQELLLDMMDTDPCNPTPGASSTNGKKPSPNFASQTSNDSIESLLFNGLSAERMSLLSSVVVDMEPLQEEQPFRQSSSQTPYVDSPDHVCGGGPMDSKTTKEQDDRPAKYKRKFPFVIKLHHILDDVEKSGRQDIISFSADGTNVVLRKPAAFSKEIMGDYFKSTRLTTFERQMNLYDFQRSQHLEHEAGERGAVFHNENFVRGRKDLALKIKRKKQPLPWGRGFLRGTPGLNPPDFSVDESGRFIPPLTSVETPKMTDQATDDSDQATGLFSALLGLNMRSIKAGQESYSTTSRQPPSQSGFHQQPHNLDNMNNMFLHELGFLEQSLGDVRAKSILNKQVTQCTEPRCSAHDLGQLQGPNILSAVGTDRALFEPQNRSRFPATQGLSQQRVDGDRLRLMNQHEEVATNLQANKRIINSLLQAQQDIDHSMVFGGPTTLTYNSRTTIQQGSTVNDASSSNLFASQQSQSTIGGRSLHHDFAHNVESLDQLDRTLNSVACVPAWSRSNGAQACAYRTDSCASTLLSEPLGGCGVASSLGQATCNYEAGLSDLARRRALLTIRQAQLTGLKPPPPSYDDYPNRL